MDIRQRRLPTEYQEVEWIKPQEQNPSNVFIDLDFTTTTQTGLKTKFKHGNSTAWGAYFGAIDNGDCRFCLRWRDFLQVYFGSWILNSSDYDTTKETFLEFNYMNSRKFLLTQEGIDIQCDVDSGYNSTVTFTLFKQHYQDYATWREDQYQYEMIFTEGTTISHIFVPCYRKLDNVAGVFDIARQTFYSNGGTGTILSGPAVITIDEIHINQRLPKEYQEVEWIEGDGNQCWIDSTYIPNASTEVKFKYEITSEQTQIKSNHALFGCSTGYQTGNAFEFLCANQAGKYIWIQYGDQDRIQTIITDEPVEVELLDKCWYINNNKAWEYTDTLSIENGLNLYLFRTNRGAEWFACAAKLYYLEIYDHDILVRKFIPCYRISDNIVGLYDLTNDKFYTNQGEGSFLKGDNIYTGLEITQIKIENNILWRKPLKFNQLLQNGNFTSGTDFWYARGGDIAVNSNNELTYTVTTIDPTTNCIYQRLTIAKGHKFMLCISVKSDMYRINYAFRANNVGGGPAYGSDAWGGTNYNDTTFTNLYSVQECSGGEALSLALNVWYNIAIGQHMIYNSIMFIDLTEMYGLGNEPTDVATVLADCKSLGHDLSVYQPYTPIT